MCCQIFDYSARSGCQRDVITTGTQGIQRSLAISCSLLVLCYDHACSMLRPLLHVSSLSQIIYQAIQSIIAAWLPSKINQSFTKSFTDSFTDHQAIHRFIHRSQSHSPYKTFESDIHPGISYGNDMIMVRSHGMNDHTVSTRASNQRLMTKTPFFALQGIPWLHMAWVVLRRIRWTLYRH